MPVTRNTDHLQITHHERDQLGADLRAVVGWLADMLEDTLTKQTSHTAGPRVAIGRGREYPLPFNPRAAKTTRALRDTLNRWIVRICEQRHLPHPGRTDVVASDTPVPYAPVFRTFTAWELLDIRSAATWLARPRHLVALSLVDNGHDGYLEIRARIKAARGVIERPQTPDYVGTCAGCDADLWALDDDTYVTCANCEQSIDRTLQEERVDRELRGRLFTARELVTIVADRLGQTIKPKTVYALTYRRGNPIAVRGKDIAGDNLYLCGDVLDALTRRPRARTRALRPAPVTTTG